VPVLNIRVTRHARCLSQQVGRKGRTNRQNSKDDWSRKRKEGNCSDLMDTCNQLAGGGKGSQSRPGLQLKAGMDGEGNGKSNRRKKSC